MIVVTGAAGFIASNLVRKLNSEGFKDIILVDDFSKSEKRENYELLVYTQKIDRANLFSWLDENHKFVQFIFHLGARTDTTEFDYSIFERLNLIYSKEVWKKCCEYGISLVYASSAATYGDGTLGYDDNERIISKLEPLNPYGKSKNEFDKWVLEQPQKPYFWAGLKFFNVYGPNESHKKRMASVIFHAFNQICTSGQVKLFKSHHKDFAHGEQKRDFIYVKDIAKVCLFFLHHRKNAGIYNLGTGKARTFNDLALSTFKSLNLKPNIHYIDIPQDIRDKYQYFTEANMNKLISIGYHEPFYTLEEGVEDYINSYLKNRHEK